MRYTSRYTDHEASTFVDRYQANWNTDVAHRVYTSQLLGRDPTLVLHGGGNTSVKSSTRELTGAEVEVLYVKGSGWDLGQIEPSGFPACRLQPLLAYCQLSEMSDAQMVQGLRSQMLDPSSPTPSVEALLHAFIPGKFVDHTHADAVLAVLDQPDSETRCREIWGDEMLFVPYVMPGFVLAKRIAQLGDQLSGKQLMILDKHGIFTWGASARESYELMLSNVAKAADHTSQRLGARTISVPGEPSPEKRASLQSRLSPVVRGALGQAEDGQHLLLGWRDSRSILALLERPDAKELTSIGTLTPDHVIRTKAVPAWLGAIAPENPDSEPTRAAIVSELTRFGDAYASYFERGSNNSDRSLTRLDRLPRVLLVPGLGAITAGKTTKDTRVAADIYEHTADVLLQVAELSGYRPVGELDLFDLEYWSLEQAKLKQGKAAGPLARKIALVTGAASGIGRATAEHLLAQGAHVMICDHNGEALEATLNELSQRHPERVAKSECDVTDPSQVEATVRATAWRFGGVDILVSNAGNAPTGQLHEQAGDDALQVSLRLNFLSHQSMARAAVNVLTAQGLGGCLLFNASKSAFNQGPDFGPYAVPKAALVALMKQYAVDLGASKIRSNAVNADRIRTDLFGGGVLGKRAAARKVSPEEYFRLNLLHRETTALDVAEAFGWLATAHATTGCVVTVDGGNPAAFPR